MSHKEDDLKQDSRNSLGWERLKEGMGVFLEALVAMLYEGQREKSECQCLNPLRSGSRIFSYVFCTTNDSWEHPGFPPGRR